MVKVRKEDIEKTTQAVYDTRKEIGRIYGKESVEPNEGVQVQARNLDGLYFNTVFEALKHGEINPVEEGSHAGELRIEFPGYMGIVTHPTERPLAPITREGIPVMTDENAIYKYFQEYLLNGELNPNEHYRYSSWVVGIPELYSQKKADEIGLNPGDKKTIQIEHKGIPRGTRLNQLEWCANHFAQKGFGTNHCAITIGCAEGLQRYDWPYDPETSETDRGTSECLRDITLKIRKGNQLDLSTFWRSWDLVEGFPENLGGIVHLMEYTATLINSVKKDSQPEVIPGRLYAYSDGLHIYSHSLDVAKLWANIKTDK
ncbi:hypothetical protein K9L16_00850 [Candidatus Pacearchaeota archaeon]|nr:hypothetical protein [Candidatus Pacearchaeota archaeon]